MNGTVSATKDPFAGPAAVFASMVAHDASFGADFAEMTRELVLAHRHLTQFTQHDSVLALGIFASQSQ